MEKEARDSENIMPHNPLKSRDIFTEVKDNIKGKMSWLEFDLRCLNAWLVVTKTSNKVVEDALEQLEKELAEKTKAAEKPAPAEKAATPAPKAAKKPPAKKATKKPPKKAATPKADKTATPPTSGPGSDAQPIKAIAADSVAPTAEDVAELGAITE